MLTQIYEEQGRFSTTVVELNAELGVYVKVIDAEQLALGNRFVLAASLPMFDASSAITDDAGRVLRVITLPTVIPPSDVGVNDPLPVLVPIDSVYMDESP